MKALILAAGFGTRLLPHTSVTPKPLFSLNGVPVLQRCIQQLIQAGCTSIIINTHHLNHRIEQFIERCKSENQFRHSVHITTTYEPVILNTGGAIRNVRNFMEDEPFMVINSDIVSDIDLKKVWDFHITGNWCATLVLHDYPIYNKVMVDKNLFIRSFSRCKSRLIANCDIDDNSYCDYKDSYNGNEAILAFTGVQVLSPEIFEYIYNGVKSHTTSQVAPTPSLFAKAPFSSIDLYSHLANQGDLVKAFICKDIFWQDIGTPETYRDAAIRFEVAEKLNFNGSNEYETDGGFNSPFTCIKDIVIDKLAGDGSDRRWFRCRLPDFKISDSGGGIASPIKPSSSVIVADHGIYHQEYISNDSTQCRVNNDFSRQTQEIDAFINIGNHLFKQGIKVPEIKGYDRFAGLVVLEDLGDTHLQDLIILHGVGDKFINTNLVLECYRKICSLAIDFSIKGIIGFDDNWTFQTSSYSKDMILEKECLYFVEAFLQGYLKLNVQFDDFIDEFEFIADNALDGGFEGLMHRDMQSRNIMVKGGDTFLANQNLLTDPNLGADGGYLDENLFFIDFQSARRGPLQYDLASLLIDPYVNLTDEIKDNLLDYCVNQIERLILYYPEQFNFKRFDQKKFIKCYRYCSVTRNMQMLGAFSNLSMNKGKTFFEQYIPLAMNNLKKIIHFVDTGKIPLLYSCITTIQT